MMKTEQIKELIKTNNGVLSSKDLTENNIHRQYLKNLVDEGYLVKVSRGGNGLQWVWFSDLAYFIGRDGNGWLVKR